MNPRTSIRHFGVLARCSVLLAVTGLFVGCTGGPKLSLTSPSTWPGVSRVTGAGHKVGGWVKEKATWRRPGKKTQAATLARRESSQATAGDETNRKLRAILTQAIRGNPNGPADPFLAQTASAQPKVESVSHSSDATQDGIPTIHRQAADFTSAAQSANGSVESIPEKSAPINSNVNPFADLANSRSTSEAKPSGTYPVENPFARGIDTQLAQLRRQASGGDASNATNDPPAERNLIRDAILGITEDDPQPRLPDLPSDGAVPEAKVILPIEEFNEPAEVADSPVGRAVIRSDETATDLLPEWARESPTKSARRELLPTADTTSATIPRIDPVDDAPVGPFEESPSSERIRVATDVREGPLTAIQIVPSRTQFPSEMLTDDADAALRVELLPPPADALVVEKRGGLYGSGDSFGGMIVETDTLSPGFAEWHGNDGTRATLHTNSPLEARGVSSTTNAAVPARLAVNSRAIPTDPIPAAADSDTADQNPFIIRHHLLREVPSPLPVSDDVPDAVRQTKPDRESLLFLPTKADEQALESALPPVSFDPETEPGAAAGDSLFESTAVIGLLIGLVCLIGLALIRRMHSTA